MKKSILLFVAFTLLLNCKNQSNNKVKEKAQVNNTKELENKVVSVELKYFGWGCPCPQWISKENLTNYTFVQENYPDSIQSKDVFWNIISSHDSIANISDLYDDFWDTSFVFTGKFYKEKQYLGDEGELFPGKTLLYHKVELKK